MATDVRYYLNSLLLEWSQGELFRDGWFALRFAMPCSEVRPDGL